MKSKEFTEKVANELTEINKEIKEDFITGEKNLLLSRKELKDKLLKLKDGKSYIGVLAAEHRILEGQGAISLKFTEDEVLFYIPDWDSFISRVNAFHVACGPY